MFTTHLQQFVIGQQEITLAVPDIKEVEAFYANAREEAYWARTWPAAIGLSEFLEKHSALVENKTVVELAAGLGLPGLVAARYATEVLITEKAAAALPFLSQSATAFENVTVKCMDWNEVKKLNVPGIVLLSDVNYEPAVFENLKELIGYLLQRGTMVIISTPQRLVAKDFISPLLIYSEEQWQTTVTLQGVETDVSVFVLKDRPVG